MNTVLIAGATGVIGQAALYHFSALPDWDTIAISRRDPEPVDNGSYSHYPLDLGNRADCDRTCARFDRVTHVIYAAVSEKPGLLEGWQDPAQMSLNLAMLQNLLEPLCSSAHKLQHISLLQGAKAYGPHVGDTPALAAAFDVQAGPAEPLCLAQYLEQRTDSWDRIVALKGLRPLGLADFLGQSHHYADILLRAGARTIERPTLLSTIKLRQAGFSGCRDSLDSVRYWIHQLRGARLIP